MVIAPPPDDSDRPRDHRRRLPLSLAVTYGSDLGNALLSLANVLIVSRALGPAGRGDVVFLTTVAFLTSSLAALGVHEANVNLAGVEPRLRSRLATNSVAFAILLGGIAVAAVASLVALFPAVGAGSDKRLLALALAAIPMLLLQVYLRLLVQADYGFIVTSIAWFVGPLLNVLGNGLFAALGLITVATAFGTWVLGQALGTLILAWYVGFRLQGFGRPDFQLGRRVIHFGARSHAGRIMLLGNYRLDQWILGAVAGPAELGIYSIAVACAETLWFLPTSLGAVIRPDVVRASRADAARQTALAFRAATVVTLISVAALVLLAPFAVTVVFGDEFEGAVDDLRILCLGAFGVVALKLLGGSLTAQRRPTLASLAIGVGFVTTVVLDFVLIPPYGGLGAAVASTVAYTAGGVAIVVVFSRVLGAPLQELVPRPREFVALVRQSAASARRRRRRGSSTRARLRPDDAA